MLFTLIDDRDAWMKFFEYFDLVQKIEDATHTNIERLANALSIKFYDISNHRLSCELYEEGNAGGGVQFTIDDIICEARFYATGSEELDDSFPSLKRSLRLMILDLISSSVKSSSLIMSTIT